MKKILFSAMAAVLMLGASAQQRQRQQMPPMRDGQENRGFQRNDMYEGLNLTEKQKQQLADLRADQMAKRNQIRDDNTLSQEQKRTAMQELQKNMRSQMETILTPGQRAQLEEKMKSMGDRAQQGRRGTGSWQGLTPDQQSKVKELNDLYNKKEQEIKDNTFLSKDAKQQQIKELADQKRKAMDNILTPEQKQNMRKGRERGDRFNDRPTRQDIQS